MFNMPQNWYDERAVFGFHGRAVLHMWMKGPLRDWSDGWTGVFNSALIDVPHLHVDGWSDQNWSDGRAVFGNSVCGCIVILMQMTEPLRDWSDGTVPGMEGLCSATPLLMDVPHYAYR